MSRATLCLFALSALLSCTFSSAAGRGHLASGVWGGPHIRLDIAEDGTAAVELDCAHGSTTEPIVPDGKGTFRAAGTYVQERGGPVREGQEDAGRPAVFAGKAEGGTMTLTITLTGSGEELGTFELTRGKTPRLTKCM
jgi:hypothetical protein